MVFCTWTGYGCGMGMCFSDLIGIGIGSGSGRGKSLGLAPASAAPASKAESNFFLEAIAGSMKSDAATKQVRTSAIPLVCFISIDSKGSTMWNKAAYKCTEQITNDQMKHVVILLANLRFVYILPSEWCSAVGLFWIAKHVNAFADSRMAWWHFQVVRLFRSQSPARWDRWDKIKSHRTWMWVCTCGSTLVYIDLDNNGHA